VLPVLAAIIDTHPSIPIVLWVSDIGDFDTMRACRMGARGILRRTDSVPVLLACLRAVGSGESWMDGPALGDSRQAARIARITARERDVLEQVCRGLSNHEIARSLSIAPGTVKVHLTHLFEKTGLRDRFALAEHGRRFLEGGEVSSRS
jgi:two-component system nitrate/nitrite response regulator NarL